MTAETQLKHQIKDYLDLKGVYHFPVLQGLGAMKGIPDRFAIKDGVCFGIEAKAPTGKQSEHQINFQLKWEENGGIYILAYKLEDVMEYL